MLKHDFPFSLMDICRLEGVDIPNSGRSKCFVTCPVCGKKNLHLDFQKDLFKCFTASCETKGGVLHFYRYLEGREELSFGEARAAIMESLFGVSNTKTEEERMRIQNSLRERRLQAKASEIPQASLRNLRDRDETYSKLLDLLNLAPDHLSDLLNRGFLKDDIIKRRYKTVPLSAYEEYPLKLLEAGLYLDGVPGFFKNEKGKWELRKSKRGFMVPIMSRNNLIQGFQIRKDERLLRSWPKKDKDSHYVLDENKLKVMEKEKKYQWLSSRDLPYGSGPNGFIHYACDFERDKNGVYVPRLSFDGGIVLTEGGVKGDIFKGKTNYPALCVPGVSCQAALEKELYYLKQFGFKKIYSGYDMDYQTNPDVCKALVESYKLILKYGFVIKRLRWSSTDNGIDDHYRNILP